MQGTLEAIYHAIPLLCIPLGADQTYNCVKARKEGYAVLIDWKQISEETLEGAIRQLIKDLTYFFPSMENNYLILSSPYLYPIFLQI